MTGVLSKGSFADVNAAIGRLIASVPEDKTMDVYYSFKALVGPDVPAYLMSTVKEDDAKAAYEGLVAFKDVVKANPISPTEPTLSSKLAADKLEAVGALLASLPARPTLSSRTSTGRRNFTRSLSQACP